ncbi:hypothetical protein HOI26_02055 [Candidatus Woesearchaeota archaeon]|jgi:uncharacterized membrane protein|nr:hypothetical protein [Candidatus Woesearchaeota archaeon]MBT5739861.1 hypothetical protein [Candidatus Woesearchaeota archaeon]
MNKIWLVFVVLFIFPLVSAATLQGTVYDASLEIANDVLVELNTIPAQRMLSQDGIYQFDVPVGMYTLTAQQGEIIIEESITITKDGNFQFDIFLLPSFAEEDDLWADGETEFFTESTEESSNKTWTYIVAGLIFAFALFRVYQARKKYGPLRKFRKKKQSEARKTVEEHKADLESEPGQVDAALEIIKKHDGRITQKQLRREMLHLSEAKVSLILTELEHKSLVEKVKKGRGNVILLK